METYNSSSKGTIFDMVNFDKVMQMVTIPGNPSYMMLEA